MRLIKCQWTIQPKFLFFLACLFVEYASNYDPVAMRSIYSYLKREKKTKLINKNSVWNLFMKNSKIWMLKLVE